VCFSKTFYQTSNIMTLKNTFWQATGTSNISNIMVQKSELSAGKEQVNTHTGQCWSCTQSASDTMFPVTLYQKNINTHHYATGYDPVSLQNPNGIDAQCSQNSGDVISVGISYSLCSSTLPPQTTYGLVINPISTSIGSWTKGTRGSEPLKIHI